MTRVKICGIKTLQEAKYACDHGVWAIGEVFAPSPRRIAVEDAVQINCRLNNNVLKIGVFVDETVEKVNHIADICGLDMVQLHGDETPEYIKQIKRPVLKSLAVRGPVMMNMLEPWQVWGFIFDAPRPAGAKANGGNGVTFPWEWLEAIKGRQDIFLAGGLTAQNVGSAIRQVLPGGVDVSSGVEDLQGDKAAEKIAAFMAKVQETDRDLGRLMQRRGKHE